MEAGALRMFCFFFADPKLCPTKMFGTKKTSREAWKITATEVMVIKEIQTKIATQKENGRCIDPKFQEKRIYTIVERRSVDKMV